MSSKRILSPARKDAMPCDIKPVAKRRDGGTRYWCLVHKADATAKYGRRAKKCRGANLRQILPEEVFNLRMNDYPGGVSLWGAVPPVYDTTRLGIDRGIHVHARKEVNGVKKIDQTYRGVRIFNSRSSKEGSLVSELDAIYYMVSAVFGFTVSHVNCTFCGYSHLDKDWFSVHPHRRHLYAGCGKMFMDAQLGIGNPIASLSQRNSKAPIEAKKKLNINQADYPGGIQIWGSNPAFIWTSPIDEDKGIHVHAYRASSATPIIEDTYSSVTIDGIRIDPDMVRTLMAQSALPHLEKRIVSLNCPKCRLAHFDSGVNAITPTLEHKCVSCGYIIKSRGRVRKVVANPLLATLEDLAAKAPRPPQRHRLDLLPETL